MKNRRRFAILAAALVLLLCSCSSTETEALPKTIRSPDKAVSLSVPESWSEYETELRENLVLAIQDGEGAFAQVFWYPDAEGKDLAAADYENEAKRYYGDAASGSAAKIKLKSGNEGYYFAYSKRYLDTGGERYAFETFQGYEYFIDFAGGVAEVDIFYQYTDTGPTNDELLELRSIAETVRVNA